MQHGQFYAHQRYMGQQGRIVTSQNPNLGNRSVGDIQQGHHRGQSSTLVNGQAYAQHVSQQQQRGQGTPQTVADFPRQYDLLQNQAFFNQALQQRQQQAQSLTHQEQQQRLLRQQQQQQTDPNTSLRNLLANTYTSRTALDQLSFQQQHSLQQHTLNQFGLGQTTVPHISATLQQHGERIVSSSKPGNTQHARVIMNEQQRREMTQPSEATVQNSLRNRQNISQDLLSRHISSTSGRSPTGFHPNMGTNIYSNLLLRPNPNNAMGLLTPQGAYSPVVSHNMARGPVNRLPTRSEPTGIVQNNIGFNNNQSRSVSRDLQSPQRLTTSGPVINTHVHVKRQTSSANSCAAPVIISDSEDESGEPQKPSTSGTFTASAKKENKKDPNTSPSKSLRVVIDDDIEIVGMKEAEVMSHMRSDCPIHIFKRIDSVSEKPQAENVSKCSKCFCYVCDKISSECPSWTDVTFPHCNAHSRASCWKARRNTKKSPLMLRLSGDDLSPEIEQAGVLAMQYMIQIRELYITYRAGTPCEYLKVPCNCTCHNAQADPCSKCKVVHDMKKKFNYEPVREIALRIIREIQTKYSKTNPQMALIMLEAVLSELCSQRPADFNHSIRMPSNPDPRCQCNFPNIIEEHIEKELVEIFTRHEISTSFRNHLAQCVERSIQPLQLENIMKRFLNMRHWDNIQLRTVLTGGINNRREVLRESADVIKLRVEKLDRDKRYQGILRYLRNVKILQSSKSTVTNQQIMELMEQWNILYSAKQGHFRDVVLRLTEPIVELCTVSYQDVRSVDINQNFLKFLMR